MNSTSAFTKQVRASCGLLFIIKGRGVWLVRSSGDDYRGSVPKLANPFRQPWASKYNRVDRV